MSEIKYEWEDVTSECEAKLAQYEKGEYYILIDHDGDTIHEIDATSGLDNDEASLDDDYRICLTGNDNFRIERRVEVELPEDVYIRVWSKDVGGDCLSRRCISYKSAVEFGLIKDGD